MINSYEHETGLNEAAC